MGPFVALQVQWVLLNVGMLAAAAFGPPNRQAPDSSGAADPKDAQPRMQGGPDREDSQQGQYKSKLGKLSGSSAPAPTTSRKCAVTVFGDGFGDRGSFFDEDVDEDMIESWEEGIRSYRLLQILREPGMSDNLPGQTSSVPTCLPPLTKADYAKSFRPM